MSVPIGELLARAPLYAILDTSIRPELSPAEILEPLLRAGVKLIQYRNKEPFRKAQLEQCAALARRVGAFGGKFIVNDRADVAKLCGAAGVHLGQDDLPPDKARLFLEQASVVGFSTHNLEQAREAVFLPIDYIAIGPIFPTASKKEPDPVVGLEMIARVRSLTTLPLVAIGGIKLENASAVMQAGADAVAVIGDLLQAADIEDRARQFLAALRTCRS
ncbi:MAG: thiamine phosphate synthase [Acidobacteriota bacterium]